MKLSSFAGEFAEAHGAPSLEGAMVFVMMNRPLDKLIAQALSNGPYHPGKPSPWSHCFLIAEPFSGPNTKILDCTIRDANGQIIWNDDLLETLKLIFDSTVGPGAGGIYEAKLSDYDDARVTARGIKRMADLSSGERRRIVGEGQTLRQKGVRYDLPGLVRELVRLLTTIEIPPAENRLFCSAFLQATYHVALGDPAGDFAPNVRDEDTTPDDIWYSPKGASKADVADELG